MAVQETTNDYYSSLTNLVNNVNEKDKTVTLGVITQKFNVGSNIKMGFNGKNGDQFNSTAEFEVLDIERHAESGFYATLVKDIDTGEKILVVKGSEKIAATNESFKDWFDNNFVIGADKLPPQFPHLVNFIRRVKSNGHQIDTGTSTSLGSILMGGAGSLDENKDIKIICHNGGPAERLNDNLIAKGYALSDDKSNIEIRLSQGEQLSKIIKYTSGVTIKVNTNPDKTGHGIDTHIGGAQTYEYGEGVNQGLVADIFVEQTPNGAKIKFNIPVDNVLNAAKNIGKSVIDVFKEESGSQNTNTGDITIEGREEGSNNETIFKLRCTKNSGVETSDIINNNPELQDRTIDNSEYILLDPNQEINIPKEVIKQGQSQESQNKKSSNNQVIKSKIAFDAADGNEVSQNVFKKMRQQTSTPDTPDEIIMPNHVPVGADLSNIVDRALAVTEMNSNTFVNYASFDFDIDISLDINQSSISSLNTSASIVKFTYPLVLDLEGNGIETISLSDSNAYFDLDGDGFAEKVGWLSKNDATLVIDKNNNGIIEGMGEVFGDINPDTAGFTELKLLDSNNDDIIDVKDAQFNELQIWQDLNEDAITDAGELKTLQQANIESINLNYGEMHQNNNSNYIAYASTYTTTGGQVRLIGDAFYVYDKTQSFYDNDYVFNADSIHLPWLKGYGVVKDLQLVLPTNTALLNLVTNLTTQTNPQTVYNGFDEVLERWGDINTTLSTNEKKRLLLNKFIGENVQSVSSENQGYLDLSYRILKNKYFTEFISYTSIGIDYGITHDFVSDSISIDENIFYDAIVDNFADRNDYLSSFAILESVEASGELNFDKLNNSISGSNDGSILMEYLFNSNKNFMFASALSTNGTVGSDLIIGMTGNDTITGGDGNDVIIAEDGNDSITDTAGNDTYLFNLGNGSDTITDSDGNDVFKFGQNINVEDVIFTQNNNDMEVSIKNTTDKVTIKNWYTDDKNKIETFAFASGDAIFSNNLDVVTNSGQPIADLTKDDTYLLNSSTNNNIWDFNGNDTYIYNLGSGKIAFEDTYTDYGDQDIIYWLFGKTDNSKISDSKYTDELRFGAGINKEDVTFVKVGKNLEIQVNEQDSVTVKNWFHAHREKLGSLWDFHLYRNKMEFITFADGSYLHKSEITDYVNSTDISPNTYTLANNNSIADPGGDDTYIFNKNIGSATITESHGVDSLQFDVGIALADMEFIRIDKDLIIESSVNSDKLTVKDWYRSANKQIETIKFSDTTLTNKDIYDMPITIYGTDNIDEDLTDGISNVEELVGNNNDNIIYGLDGDDKIFDFKGDDTINAGKGADTLADYDGNDTYIYKSGDGKLIIYDYVGEDTIKFEGLTLNNLDISRNKDDLEIAVSSGGKITVKNCYSNTNNFIENIQFGTTVYQTDDKINNLIADSAGNILVANALNNNLNGNESADYMYAKATLCKARQ